MIHIQKFIFNPIQENTYVLYSDKNDAVIIDPGCYFREEELELISFIESNELNVQAILNTHAHIDHVLGNAFCCKYFSKDLYLHSNDLDLLKAVDSYAHLYGMNEYKTSPLPKIDLKNIEVLHFASIKLNVIFGPGHSPGHVAFYSPDNNFIISGDILFKGSFGRVDLPGGDIETLKNTIHNKFFTLNENTVIYSGHGEETTISIEKKSNYILNF